MGASIFVALCALYNTLIMRSEDAEFAPPGQLVDVGGYKLHLHCYGSNSNTEPDAATSPDQEPRFYPTVVFDHAMMTLRKQFHKVLAYASLTNKTRICVYDRAGYGNSDPSPKIRYELPPCFFNTFIISTSPNFIMQLSKIGKDGGEGVVYAFT